MLHEQTKSHILSLSDGELLRYVLTGRRVYDADPLLFAQEELERRAISAKRLAELRPPILAELAAMDAGAEPDPTRPQAPAIVCQICGVEAPTAHREYLQSIALLFLHERKRYAGSFCKRCSNGLFIRTTISTLLFGWLDHFSLFIVPACSLQNTMQFLASLPLRSVPRGTPRPAVDDAALAGIAPYLGEIAARMLAGEEAGVIARDVAAKAGLTPGQVWRYLQTTARNQASGAPAPRDAGTRLR